VLKIRIAPLNLDVAIEYAHLHYVHLMRALRITLFVIEIVSNRSVKISNLAALKDREN
jgi:hypothetical protein